MNADDLLSSARDDQSKTESFDVNSFLNCETTQQEQMESMDVDQPVATDVDGVKQASSTGDSLLLGHQSVQHSEATKSTQGTGDSVANESSLPAIGDREKADKTPAVETEMASESLPEIAQEQNIDDNSRLVDENSTSPSEQPLHIFAGNEEENNDAHQHIADNAHSDVEEWDIITAAECEEAKRSDNGYVGSVSEIANSATARSVGETASAELENKSDCSSEDKLQSENPDEHDDSVYISQDVEQLQTSSTNENKSADEDHMDESHVAEGEIRSSSPEEHSAGKLQSVENSIAGIDSVIEPRNDQLEMEEENDVPEKGDVGGNVAENAEEDKISRSLSGFASSARGRGRPSRRSHIGEALVDETDSREVRRRGSSRRQRGEGTDAAHDDDVGETNADGLNGRVADSIEKEGAMPRRQSTPKSAAVVASQSSGRSSRPVRQSRSIPGSYIFGDEFVSDSPLVRKRPQPQETKTTPVSDRKSVGGKRRRVADSESDHEAPEKDPRLKDAVVLLEPLDAYETAEDREAAHSSSLATKRASRTATRERPEAKRVLPARAGTSKGNNTSDTSALESDKKDENESNVFDGLGFDDDDMNYPAQQPGGTSISANAQASDSSKLARKPLFSSHERNVGVKFNMKEMKFTLARARDILRPPLEGKWKLDVDPKQEKQLIAKKMQDLRELERKLQAKDASAKQREQRLKQLDEEVDEKRMMLKAQEAKYNQVMLSKERRIQMLEIKLHRQEHTLSMKEKQLEAIEKKLADHLNKPDETDAKKSDDVENKEADGAENTKLDDPMTSQETKPADDGQEAQPNAEATASHNNGEEENASHSVDAADHLDTDALDNAPPPDNANGADQNGADAATAGEEQDQTSECKDWVERLTMLEKRLRQKDASLHNLEDTLLEMKTRLDRRRRELAVVNHDLESKETVLKTAEHQLAMRGSELAGHYRALNERQQYVGMPETCVPLVCAGSVILLGSVDSMTREEVEASDDVPVGYLRAGDSMSEQSDHDDDDDDDRANGLLTRERNYSKAVNSAAADVDVPPSSQGCDKETWLRIVGGSSSPTKTSTPALREGSAVRSLAAATDTAMETSDTAADIVTESNNADADTDADTELGKATAADLSVTEPNVADVDTQGVEESSSLAAHDVTDTQEEQSA